MKRTVLYIGLVCLLMLVASSCNQNTSNNNKKAPKECDFCGGNLRINEPIFFNTINPHLSKDAVSAHIISLIHDGLVKYNAKNLDFEPAIAKKWKLSNNNKLITFTLNENAYFHDDPCFEDGKGRKILASDFKYSFELLLSQGEQAKSNFGAATKIVGVSEFWEKVASGNTKADISGIKALNDSTLQIELISENPLFFHFLAGTSAKVISKEAYVKYAEINKVGSGAFIMKTYPDVNQPIVFSKNTNYYRKDKDTINLPYLDEVVMTFIGATPKELNMFNEGRLDLVMGLPISYINPFIEENLDGFKGENIRFVLDASKENPESELYNLLSVKLKNFYTNRINYIDLSIVYIGKDETKKVQ